MRAKMLVHKHLSRFKLPENIYEEKDEGYDGRLTWENTPAVQQTMAVFRRAVKEKDAETVKETLDTLGAGTSDKQVEHIASLIFDGSVEPLKEALMSAICIGSRPLAEFILCLFHDHPHEERSGCTESDAFPPHLTPLILACISNNFALVECLLLRGHSIEFPHHRRCQCDICDRQPYAALASVQKVDIIRAICSDAYLWLATDDPFAAACSLSEDLDRFIYEDNLEYTDWYRGLQTAVQLFATRMANQMWYDHELDLFLSYKLYCDHNACEEPYPRVQLALDCGMREFVASTNVQRAMNEIWWRGWGDFGANLPRDCYRLARHTIFYPILALIYVLSNGKLASSFDVPLARYISNATSYAIFIASLLTLSYIRPDNKIPSGFQIGIECYIYLYVVGMVVERYIVFSRQGFRVYFQFWWRWYDFLLLGSFLLSLFFWSIECLAPQNPPIDKRKHIGPWNEVVFHDVFLSTGCMLAIWRVFYYFQLKKGVGATVISVGRCIRYVTNYMFIIAVIAVSFAVGLNMLLKPYVLSREEGIPDDLGNQFASIVSGLKSLYWTFYGYMDLKNGEIVVGKAGPNNEMQQYPLIAGTTECLLAIYHLIAVITVLNLMVSLMVRKGDEVLDNEELEFKYVRVVIIREYVHWFSAVPPPFNLLLIPVQLVNRLFRRSYVWNRLDGFVNKNLVEREMPDAEEEAKAYNNLIQKAFLRFRCSREYHYKSVFRADGNLKEKPTFARSKVAYLSETNSLARMDCGEVGVVPEATKRKANDEDSRLISVHFGRVLGEGAFGVVRLCLLPHRRKPLAVKCMDLTEHSGSVNVFRKEAQMHRSCCQNGGHPNLIHCYGYQLDIDRHEFQIFLEFADGGELFDKIEPEVGVPLADAKSYFCQLISGVKYMHGLGIAHRDIKPENLLVNGHGVLKISDFGMATMFKYNGQERNMTSYCGTLPYMAPEVYLRAPYKAEPSDIWSCGMVLVTLLVGELPWGSPDKADERFKRWIDGTDIHEFIWKKLDTKAISLLRIILAESPENRATIDRIEKHQWYNTDHGFVLGARGKHQMLVDQADFDAASQPVHRALPAKVARYTSSKAFSQPGNIDLLTDSQVSDTMEPLNPLEWLVKRMTRFCVTIPLEQIITRVKNAGEECGFSVKDTSTVGHLIVIFRDVHFFVNILEMYEEGKRRVMLDFRRSRGDGLEFKKAFMLLKDRMKDVICEDGDRWMESQGITSSQAARMIY